MKRERRWFTGSNRPADFALSDDHYIEPAVFTDVDNEMRIAREEIFGPMLQSFESYDEAIDLANATSSASQRG